MKDFLTIAAASALAAVSFSTSAFAQTATTQQGMSAEEHQRMMSSGGTAGQGQMTSNPDMHRRMMAMMERCEEMMAKKDKSASISGRESARKTSAEGEWLGARIRGRLPDRALRCGLQSESGSLPRRVRSAKRSNKFTHTPAGDSSLARIPGVQT